jgi:hypothetical protein
MEINEPEAVAHGVRVVVRFVVSGEHPEPRAERFENFAAAVESLAEGRQIAGADVQIGGLRYDAFERAKVAVNVAEDQDFHGEFLF